MKIKAIIKYFLIFVIGLILLRIFNFLFVDEKEWESPYDKKLIDNDIILSVENNNVSSIVQSIEQLVLEWTGSNELIKIYMNTKKNDNSTTYYNLIYDIENIDEYVGLCKVICYYEDGNWVIKNAESNYYQGTLKKDVSLKIEDIEEVYEKSQSYLKKHDFFDGIESELIITSNGLEIIVYGEDDGKRNILEKKDFKIKKIAGEIIIDFE